ncbi:transmembrane protein 151B-like [Prorops nasuta]|uniref:transmembrane protein 151B-like n=1 Tax=Prorops nasuta TaxID=863751 RepID=UPI0034CD1437
MNRDNEEQRAVPQTFCGALQKEPNCKCLVLSVLIYGCLAAVTWCRCANVTKIVINFSKYPIKSTKHVSPCDDGYIYIPFAFMGMLYLVYLVECYHSPIRINLLHSESQDRVLSKLNQLRVAQPTIWWKAVSYHYVRRKRQITRYRNGDNYTSTQVYYERVNTHAATSFYYYDYCGVKDISKELILDKKSAITKIMLSKGFAFSNMRSAAEFEDTRSRFFAEQELRDDYMEMREGLDLGNYMPTSLIAVLDNPWFANPYVYWCLSALLLSWPLRVIIEYNTQYADYQITKLFGVNYDTPTSGEPIHASNSQLSQPGSYMLAPSYSEALLMEPLAVRNETEDISGMAPSYSEALLCQRLDLQPSTQCDCSCHEVERERQPSLSSLETNECCANSCRNSVASPDQPEEPLCSNVQSIRNSPKHIPRDMSEPNLRTYSDLVNATAEFLRNNGKSLENILESDEEVERSPRRRGTGAIPKRRQIRRNTKIPTSRTYFCLKSILGQNKRRRYTLVTTRELENLENRVGVDNAPRRFLPNSVENKDDEARTLIFASPIQERCPEDPFGGKNIVPRRGVPSQEDSSGVPVFSRLRRSFAERESFPPYDSQGSSTKIVLRRNTGQNALTVLDHRPRSLPIVSSSGNVTLHAPSTSPSTSERGKVKPQGQPGSSSENNCRRTNLNMETSL